MKPAVLLQVFGLVVGGVHWREYSQLPIEVGGALGGRTKQGAELEVIYSKK